MISQFLAGLIGATMSLITFVCNGDPERIPKIGQRIKLKPGLEYQVTAYGESREVKDINYSGKPGYEVDLIGVFIIPAGSPISTLEDLFREKL